MATLPAGSSSSTSALRVSELPNPLTVDIDVADTASLLRLLGSADAMMFTGFAGLPDVYSDETIHAVSRAAVACASAIAHPRGRVVFSGCGTSGRLSHVFARGLNRWVRKQFGCKRDPFHYLIAGGDAALLLPQESVEDQPTAGQDDLARWESDLDLSSADPVVVVGISCGLSATYVGSMLQAAMARPNCTAVVLGFNPVDAVKGLKVGGWSSSFHEVLTAMLSHPHAAAAVVINPVVGPEAIAGSSRMKGGSATKIICETMATVAAALALGSGAAHRAAVTADPTLLHATIRDAFMQYEAAVRHVYASAKGIHAVVDAAAAAATTVVPFEEQLARCPGAAGVAEDRLLVSPTGAGRIAYVGVGTAGILGLIDASECNPTYGALFNAVRGFVAGAWATVSNKQGPQSLPVPPHMRGDAHLHTASVPEFVGLGCEAFAADFAPTLTPADTVILIHTEEAAEDAGPAHLGDALAAVELAKASGARVLHAIVASAASLAVGAKGPGAAAVAAIRAAVPDGVVVPLPSLTLKLNLPLSLPAGAAVAASHAAATGGAGGGAAAGSPSRAAAAAVASTEVPASFPQLLFEGSGLDTAGAPSFLGELAQKLLLNAITVTAHVRRGTIFRNRMVNVMMTNAKLFHRAVGIVADTAGCPRETAVIAVLRAIYHRDDFFGPAGGYIAVGHLLPAAPVPAVKAANVTLGELRAAGAPLAAAAALPVSNHVHNASGQRGLVPVAILLALDELARTRGSSSSVGVRLPMREADAVALLTRQPVVRLALLDALSGGSASGGAGAAALPALRDGKA